MLIAACGWGHDLSGVASDFDQEKNGALFGATLFFYGAGVKRACSDLPPPLTATTIFGWLLTS